MTSVERIMELCCLESEGNWHGKVTVPATWPELGLITAESVSFKYHPTLPRVLKNVNFCIRAQEKVRKGLYECLQWVVLTREKLSRTIAFIKCSSTFHSILNLTISINQ